MESVRGQSFVGIQIVTEVSKPDQSTSYRRIALVSGYHSCSFPPPIAYDAGLKDRFAVIISSYRPDKEGMFFDSELFILLTDAILQAIPHDSIEIEMDVGMPSLRSFSELSEWYGRNDETEREPPLRVTACSNNRLIAIEETESWSQVGGPAPYHDSFTLSFYTTENGTIQFRGICEAIANENDVMITDFHDALSRKEPFIPWWRQPLRWLGVKPW